MRITKTEVAHVAHLARLNLTEAEKDHLTKDLEAILAFADTLNSLDLDGVKPTDHVLPIHNVFRKDVIEPSMDRDLLLKNAPKAEMGCFSVPKIVE